MHSIVGYEDSRKSEYQGITVVYDGSIENQPELKDWLIKEGHTFSSETDAEVIAHMIQHFFEGDLTQAVRNTLEKIMGTYALAVTTKDDPDKIVAARKDSPLVIGIGERGSFIAFDIKFVLLHTKKCYLINNGEICSLTPEKVIITNMSGEIVNKELFEVSWDATQEKGDYEHFMLKEIYEQPGGFQTNLSGRIVGNRVKFENLELSQEKVNSWKKISIVACGTSYHAGLIGKGIFESLLHIPVEVEIASEFGYRDPLINEETLVIVISQSGETADTLVALREAKRKGASVLAITNVLASTIGREADYEIYIWSGPEIAVASTKAFTTMLLVEYLLALYIGHIKGSISEKKSKDIIDALHSLPDAANKILNEVEQYEKIAEKYKEKEDAFFVGRGFDWPVALEGALKLKETSYIHAEGYAAGEFKHGTLALVTEETLMIAICVQKNTYEKTLTNIKEFKERGAKVLAVALEGDGEVKKYADDVIYIPDINNFVAPILTVIPLQLLAYNIAKLRGCNVDQPRNLVKSITIE